jgi:hypothetical protein
MFLTKQKPADARERGETTGLGWRERKRPTSCDMPNRNVVEATCKKLRKVQKYAFFV